MESKNGLGWKRPLRVHPAQRPAEIRHQETTSIHCLPKDRWELRIPGRKHSPFLFLLRPDGVWGAEAPGDLLLRSELSCRTWGTPQQSVIYALSLYLFTEWASMCLIFASWLLTNPSILGYYQFVVWIFYNFFNVKLILAGRLKGLLLLALHMVRLLHGDD